VTFPRHLCAKGTPGMKESAMSVAAILGVDTVDRPMIMEARRKWAQWAVDEPALAPINDMLDLPGWTRSASRDAADAALRSLAKLGVPDAGDDGAATTALVWAL